jgi:translation initiation factor RLI1
MFGESWIHMNGALVFEQILELLDSLAQSIRKRFGRPSALGMLTSQRSLMEAKTDLFLPSF